MKETSSGRLAISIRRTEVLHRVGRHSIPKTKIQVPPADISTDKRRSDSLPPSTPFPASMYREPHPFPLAAPFQGPVWPLSPPCTTRHRLLVGLQIRGHRSHHARRDVPWTMARMVGRSRRSRSGTRGQSGVLPRADIWERNTPPIPGSRELGVEIDGIRGDEHGARSAETRGQVDRWEVQGSSGVGSVGARYAGQGRQILVGRGTRLCASYVNSVGSRSSTLTSQREHFGHLPSACSAP